jgi:hypothetical protein
VRAVPIPVGSASVVLCFWVVVMLLMPLLIASMGKATRYPLPRLGHWHRAPAARKADLRP